jgi:hypothetical protein
MLPSQLQADDFRLYSPEARRLAETNLALLRQLPVAFVPFLLKEIINYDSKFPVEKKELNAQLTYLSKLSTDRLREEMTVFLGLQLTPKLVEVDWVNAPGRFLEQLSAHLWATNQMDAFRSASEKYVHNFYAQLSSDPLPINRLGIAVIGQGVTSSSYTLFRKLRRQGTHFGRLSPEGAWTAILATMTARASRAPAPYAHWYIDGGVQELDAKGGLTYVSYPALRRVRNQIAERMRTAYESPGFGAEALRTALAQLTPGDVGMNESPGDLVLDRFQLSLFTEGSGTQVYSTTFVQWAAREAYRRAQPLTLLAHFVPRAHEQSMSELLSDQVRVELDPQGSLIDADMGAYYAWLDQQRLPGAATASFLAWFEDHSEAVAVGKEFAKGGEDLAPTDMASLLAKLNRQG